MNSSRMPEDDRMTPSMGSTAFFESPELVAVFIVGTLLATALVVFSAPLVTASGGVHASTSGAGPHPIQEPMIGSSSQQSGSISNSSVTFDNQTSNGSTVTVENVTLSEPGFIALHTNGYATGPAPAEYSIIAVSNRLSSGYHQNVTINVSDAPAANPPGLNKTQLNTTQTLAVTVYRDTNGNQRFDFVRSAGSDDPGFVWSGDVISDTARIRLPSEAPKTASATFKNQTLRNGTITVASARLPQGGFLVAHNATFRRTGDAVTTAVGLSRYLPPGNYTNVSLRVLQGSLDTTQIVTVRPSLDTNDNQRYDYFTSDGFRDVAYETNSEPVAVSAVVRVPPSNEASAPTRTARRTSEPAQLPVATATPSSSGSTSTSPATSQNDKIGPDGITDGLGLWIIGAGLVIVVVGIVVIVWVRR